VTAFDRLWPQILDIGRHAATGGYRRYAWSDADLTLREWFAGCAAQRGMDVEEDRNGNLWAWWMPPGWSGDPTDAFVTGSHLDSVPDGGAFDGPLGVASAFAAIDIVRERGVVPKVPVAVAAFSDEEGARFGVACIGSQLSTGALSAERARALRDVHGMTLDEAMTKAGRRPEHLGTDPRLAERVGVFVELHVEQGRALDLVDRPIAVASAIWPHGRWQFTFCGEANHAGTTRLADRRDPMLAYARLILAAREAAERRGSVATMGKVSVFPNGVNAIPSQVTAWLDARGPVPDRVRRLVAELAEQAEAAGGSLVQESWTEQTAFDGGLADRLRRLLPDAPVLATGAGHDAGILANAGIPTGMLFVRNPTGISHSPAEHAELADCHAGVQALGRVIAELAG
jgi:N-carbamoyl-L-amino-acid hydrolase